MLMMILRQRRFFTSWWQKYVDGRNPDDWARADTAKFFRIHGIDPYLVKKEALDDFRKYYLMEMNWFVGETAENKQQLAFENLAKKRQPQLLEFRGEYPLAK